MANEITVSAGLSVSKSGAIAATGTKTKQMNMAGSNVLQATQTIGTNCETLNIGEVSGIGALHITNLDNTNYVRFGLSNNSNNCANNFANLPAGMPMVFKPATDTIWAQANGAPVLLLVTVTET